MLRRFDAAGPTPPARSDAATLQTLRRFDAAMLPATLQRRCNVNLAPLWRGALGEAATLPVRIYAGCTLINFFVLKTYSGMS